MALSENISPTETISDTILAAAMRRFEQFGYSKTTMAEIAADCDMSAANIYRYFENKLEIGSRACSAITAAISSCSRSKPRCAR